MASKILEKDEYGIRSREMNFSVCPFDAGKILQKLPRVNKTVRKPYSAPHPGKMYLLFPFSRHIKLYIFHFRYTFCHYFCLFAFAYILPVKVQFDPHLSSIFDFLLKIFPPFSFLFSYFFPEVTLANISPEGGGIFQEHIPESFNWNINANFSKDIPI
jgi:hypothetical protein